MTSAAPRQARDAPRRLPLADCPTFAPPCSYTPLHTRPQIFTEAKELLPGGVNSPVRAFRSVGGNPIVFDRVKGAYIWDVDGNEYIDYVGSWGPAIVGHANDEVNEALKAQIEKGCSFGAPCELEVRLLGSAGGGCALPSKGVQSGRWPVNVTGGAW